MLTNLTKVCEDYNLGPQRRLFVVVVQAPLNSALPAKFVQISDSPFVLKNVYLVKNWSIIIFLFLPLGCEVLHIKCLCIRKKFHGVKFLLYYIESAQNNFSQAFLPGMVRHTTYMILSNQLRHTKMEQEMHSTIGLRLDINIFSSLFV